MTMTSLDLSVVAQAVAVRVVDSLVIGVLVFAFSLALLRISRTCSSAVRFAVWFSALCAIVFFTWLDDAFGFLRGARGAAHSSSAALTVPGSFAVCLFVAWAAIAAVALGRVGLSLWNLRNLRASLNLVDLTQLDNAVRRTLEHQPRNRIAVLCTSDRVTVPTAVGFMKPVVVIPAWLLDELPPAELNQILLHELAHLRRWDDWTNLAQKIVKALFFFHPAVWWIEKKISLEREMACDDVVLTQSASPQSYAACLVHLAEKSVLRRSIALAQAAVGRVRPTSLRVARILSGSRPAVGRNNWKSTASLGAVFILICVAGIARAPRLIAFDEPQAVSALGNSSSLPQLPVAGKAKIVRAAIRSRALPALTTVSPAQAPGAKATARFRSSSTRSDAPTLRQTRVPAIDSAQLSHNAAFRKNPAEPRATFVLLEQDQYEVSGNAVRGVRILYILLLNPPDNPTRAIPRKET